MIFRDSGVRPATAFALVLLVGLTAALYLPYLDNPLVFDDRTFFSGSRFADYATSPFALEPRRLPYFSIAATQVFSGSMEVHRSVSLALHAACVLALFWTLALLGVQRLPAFLAAAFFALHPAAVYAAGYLVQRTMLFATLFALLSLAFFLRGLRGERYPDALAAAAAYWMAVLSKEHSILLPAAVLCAAPLVSTHWRFSLRFGGLYAACCAPAALIVYVMRASLVGEAYEPGLGTLGLQMETSAAGYPGGSAWLSDMRGEVSDEEIAARL